MTRHGALTLTHVLLSLIHIFFENKGAAMGCSNPHPHGQIWANSFLPNEAEREDRLQKEYFAEQKSPMPVSYTHLDVYKRQVW